MRYLVAGAAQQIIRRLPYKKDTIVGLLGYLSRGKIPAVVNSAHMTLDLRETIQRAMFLGTYEPSQTKWFRQCLRPGDTVVDVGASFGYYTTLGASLVTPSGKVFAFEPSPVANQVIENAIKASGMTNVTLTKVALGRQASTVSLFMANTPYLHSPSILPSDSAFVPIDVPVIRLDEFEPLKDKTIRLLKMDVEGYEPDVLEGMTGLIKEGRVQNVVCELNSSWLGRNSTTSEALLDRFLSLGFVIREQTALQRDLPGHQGIRFDLQDIWFSRPGLPD